MAKAKANLKAKAKAKAKPVPEQNPFQDISGHSLGRPVAWNLFISPAPKLVAIR